MFRPDQINFFPFFFYNPIQNFTFQEINYLQPSLQIQTTPPEDNTIIKVQQDISSGEGLTIVKNQQTRTLSKPQQKDFKQQKKTSRYKYAKKNVESNLVSQILSFCKTPIKSKKILMKLFYFEEHDHEKAEQKVETFYQIMKQTKKKNFGYIGRSFLQNLLEGDVDHPVAILYKKVKGCGSPLKFTDIKKGLRYLTKYFLNNMIVPTVLTSSKLDKTTIKTHLSRARQLLSFANSLSTPSLN